MRMVEHVKTIVSQIYLSNKGKLSVPPCSYRRLTAGFEQMGFYYPICSYGPICYKCEYRCNGLECAQPSINGGLV